MNLTIDNLKKLGAFTGRPVEKEISWKQGEELVKATVFVRPLSYKSAVSDLASLGGNADPVAGRIAACICDAEGQAIFTPADVTGDADPERGPLDGNLTVALLSAIAEVTKGKTTS